MTHTLPLNRALKLFSDHLSDIKEACAENILHNISQVPEIPEGLSGLEEELWQEVHKLQVEQAIGPRKRIIDRIVARQQHIGNPRRIGTMVTDEQIEAAREYPIEELFATLVGTKVKRGMTNCPLHADDDTASFSMRRYNRFRCFGCDERGSTIDLYMKITGAKFGEAVRAINRM